MRIHKFTAICLAGLAMASVSVYGHGTCISPVSRVYRIFQSNPENPNFQLARNAVQMDTKNAYYTWNQVSRNIPAAVQAGLPPGFDYSPWVPDGQIASGGRVDPNVFGDLTHSGLDQVSADWPTVEVPEGSTINIDFYATAVHEPSVWDVWMTTEDWDPNTPLNWDQMEFIGRPDPVLNNGHYNFDVEIPSDRSGHHVLWIAWQRNDAVGEVFFSTSDLSIGGTGTPVDTCDQVSNGSFETNLNNWESWGSNSSWQNGKVNLTNIATSSGSPWNAGFFQSGITFVKNHEYVLEFEASSTAARNIDVKIGVTPGGAAIYSDADIAIGTSPGTYTVTFTNDMSTTSDGSVEIFLAHAPHAVTLDNFVLRNSACSSTCVASMHLELISEPEYHASQSITTNAQITNSMHVDLKAGNSIELLPSFEIEAGASMGLHIVGCVEEE